MVDAALLASLIIIPILLLFFNILVIARYVDRDGIKGHYPSLILVIILLFVAEFTVFLFPIDIGNKAGLSNLTGDPSSVTTGSIDIALLWEGLFFTIVFLLIFVVPFAIFYYEESDEGTEPTRIRKLCCCNLHQALCISILYEIIVIFIAGSILAVSFTLASKAKIEVSSVIITATVFELPSISQVACGNGACSWRKNILSIDTTFIIYSAALVCGFSNILFSIYTGVGFVALPYYGVMNFLSRPRILSAMDAMNARGKLRVRSSELFEIANDLGKRMAEAAEENFLVRSQSSQSNTTTFVFGWFSSKARRDAGHLSELNRLKILSTSLEKDLEAFSLSDPIRWRQIYNPWLFVTQLAGGLVAAVFSLLWLLHIILYMLISPPILGFFNTALTAMDKSFPPLSTLLLFILASHLLFSAISGAFAFGTRIFLINVHSMEPGKTLLNSFFFNAGLILLLTLPIVQFLRDAFASYASHSDTLVFGEQFRSIDGFRTLYQYNAYLFLMLTFSLLALLYFSFCPSRDEQTKILLKKLREHIKKRPAREIELTSWK
jgi:LMBR1 domain-containing protein 1